MTSTVSLHKTACADCVRSCDMNLMGV